MVEIDVSKLYEGQAKLNDLPDYVARALEMAGQGENVVLTGPGPVWLYLVLAHALHGVARSLHYLSPVTGYVLIFDHDPF